MTSVSAPPRATTLRITEIFHSLQGETSRTGLPTVFVRLTGCPLRCTWCDTTYSFTGGTTRSFDDILTEVASYHCQTICVTGGEPLAQKNCLPFLTALCDGGYSVSLETSGALDIGGVDPRVSRIVDLKAPDSGESARNLLSNIPQLTLRDEVKLVLASSADYEWAKAQIAKYHLTERCPVLMAPVQGQLAPADLAAWILRDRLPVRMQIQLHKVIWGNQPGR